jgi:hypothetical protein
MRAQACLANGQARSFCFQSRLQHDVQEARVGKNRCSNKHPTPHPLTNGQLFLLGEQSLYWNTKPCSFGTTQTITLFSHISTSCSHASSLNEPRSSRRLDCGEGQRCKHEPAWPTNKSAHSVSRAGFTMMCKRQ